MDLEKEWVHLKWSHAPEDACVQYQNGLDISEVHNNHGDLLQVQHSWRSQLQKGTAT